MLCRNLFGLLIWGVKILSLFVVMELSFPLTRETSRVCKEKERKKKRKKR